MKRFLGVIFTLMLVISVAVIGFPSPVLAQPSEVWVDDDYCDVCPNDGHTWGYDAFATIQDGIDAVASGTVHVAAGTYYENITLKPEVIVQGAGASITTIDGSGNYVVTADSVDSTARLDGFTITGSNYGILNTKSSSPTITNNTIKPGGEYGIINLYSSSPTITNNIIIGNGCGIYNGESSPTITNNTITGNSYAGILNLYSSPTITNNIITGGNYGISDYVQSSSTIDYNDVWDNSTNYYGCVAGLHDIPCLTPG